MLELPNSFDTLLAYNFSHPWLPAVLTYVLLFAPLTFWQFI